MGLRSWLHALSAPRPWSEENVRSLGSPKLICVVNHGLKMGKGKIAAQVGHAAVKAALFTSSSDPAMFEAWLNTGQSKVVLKAPHADALEGLMEKARKAGVKAHQVHDAGRTQIPSGSFTVLALGPAQEDELEALTGHLKLL